MLKPDGQFIFHDLFLAEGEGEFLYPVPWAESCDISHMATPDQVSGILADLGLKPRAWVDKTDQSREFFADVVERFRTQDEPPVGLNLVMGTNWLAKFSNMLKNLEHGRIAVVQAVMQRSVR